MKKIQNKQTSINIFERLKKAGLWRLIIILLVVAAVVTTILNVLIKRKQHTADIDTSYIKMMEERDVSAVKQQISENKKAEKRQLLLEGKLSIWEQFEDFAILGDSRAVGFYYFEFLERERVLAHGGATIRDIKNTYWDQMLALNPKHIFLCFGLNDISIGFWNSPEEYTEEYEQIIGEIREALPGAQICVSSILPARDPAFEKSEKWRAIPEYNAALAQMCERIGCSYADNSEISETYADLWDVDGIHVRDLFYPYWAANLIAEVEDDA